MSTPSNTASIITESAAFIGIDFHKRYSVWHAIDATGNDVGKGRIEHHSPQDFATLVKRWPNPRVVFEASMNWHWLFEVLEQRRAAVDLRTVLAHSAAEWKASKRQSCVRGMRTTRRRKTS